MSQVDVSETMNGRLRLSIWQCFGCLTWNPLRVDSCGKCKKIRPRVIK